MGQGYEVTEASDGRAACELVTAKSFDLVISDVQMPEIDGLGLLQWIKKIRPTPVVLMTAFSHLVETKRAFELGADDFIMKPFANEELLGIVSKILGGKEAESEDLDARFARIPIEDFVSGTSMNVGVYVRLSAKKFVRVAHLGDTLPRLQVESYKKKGLEYLFVKKEELATVVGFNLNLLKAVTANAAIPAQKKERFLRYTTETVLEQLMVNGIDARSFAQARESMELAIALVAESDRLTDILMVLDSHADWIYAHSLGVGLYSAMIGKAMGWNSQTNIFKLALAGLLHDVGKKEISTLVLEKPRTQQNQEERALYESHPVRSKEILSAFEGLPNDVVQVAFEHHESPVAGGFPRALPSFRIHPFARVVNVADRFCYFAMKSPISPGHDARAAFDHLRNFEHELEPAVLKAFKTCLS